MPKPKKVTVVAPQHKKKVTFAVEIQGYSNMLESNGTRKEVSFKASNMEDGFYRERVNGKQKKNIKLTKAEVMKFLKRNFPGQLLDDAMVEQAMQEVQDEA